MEFNWSCDIQSNYQTSKVKEPEKPKSHNLFIWKVDEAACYQIWSRLAKGTAGRISMALIMRLQFAINHVA